MDKSFYSFNAFINLKSSKSRLETLDVEEEKDFEILSVNATEFINGFENLSSVKNNSVDGTFCSNKSFQNNGQSCSKMMNTSKALTKRKEGVKVDEKTLRDNLEVEQYNEGRTGLRKLKRVKTMKKVRPVEAFDRGFLNLWLFKLCIDDFSKLFLYL